jgi:hypothetical protein
LAWFTAHTERKSAGRFFGQVNTDPVPTRFLNHFSTINYRRSMLPIVCTLIAVSVLAMLFPNTRVLGVAAFAALTYQYPVPSLIALFIGLVIFILNRKH